MPIRPSQGPPRPRAVNSAHPGVRELEPNFRHLYNGLNFDKWESTVWRIFSTSKGGSRFVACPPSVVVHKEANDLVSNPVDGNLRTEGLYQIASFKFDYMISPLTQGTQTKKAARSGRTANSTPIKPPHISTTLYLDQPSKIGNTALCSSITFYLAPVNFGKLMTAAHGSHHDEAFYNPTSEVRLSPRPLERSRGPVRRQSDRFPRKRCRGQSPGNVAQDHIPRRLFL